MNLKIFNICIIIIITLRSITENRCKAFYLVSRPKLLSQIHIWQKHLPFITPYYAVKSNPDQKVLEWLWKTKSVNVDCASPNEMKLTTSVGFNSNQIIYANTMKSMNDIIEVHKYNINLTTVDSVEAVEQITNNRWNPEILIRLAVDDSAAKSPFSIKFGAKKEEWRKILSVIDYYKLSFKGVSFHVGSSSSSPNAFKNAILQARLFQKYCKRYINTIDIGGGFLSDEECFSNTANKIKMEKEKWDLDGLSPNKWIAEPGRFFSNPIQTLFLPIVFCKESYNNRRYILDDSLYGQFTSIPFDHSNPHWHLLDNKLNLINRKKTDKDALFFGKTCDSMDFIAVEKNAPQYKVGDILAFPDMGAYTSATASQFNGFELPKKIYIEDENSDYSILYSKIKNNFKPTQKNVIFPISIKSEIPLSISNQL